jgi:hypothetical protein
MLLSEVQNLISPDLSPGSSTGSEVWAYHPVLLVIYVHTMNE